MIPADIDNFIIDNINYSFNCDNFIIIKGSFHKIPKEIGNCRSLKKIDLNSKEIVDISALYNLTSIEYLDLSRNQIVDISAISNYSSLILLFLNNNQIVDISILYKILSLEYIHLFGNKIKNKIKFNLKVRIFY